MLLEKLNLPEDLKKVTKTDLPTLCEEIRTVLLNQVSKTGGHLASNLGVVELTLMLLRVFDVPTDKIIWDVGHQAYVHKILTGRLNQFPTLRQKDGISGFPKCEESIYDVFNTGHSSTSISAALGMATARDLNNEQYHVISVIGDGSLTGGLAFEALNHAGHTRRNMLVILNDNEMSIRENVGALSLYLNRFRSKGIYYRIKQGTERLVCGIPLIGKALFRGLDYLKASLKRFFSIGTLFEALGFKYVGPIDGHNLLELETTLMRCKSMKGPVLLHVKTVKGKGFMPAETEPNNFHGVGPFDLTSQIPSAKPVMGYAKVVGDTLCEIAEEDENMVVVSAAMIDGTGLGQFAERFPKRIFDVGIAEAHATTFSAGLARAGKVPVFVVYSSFLQRGYDQIIHDVCMQNLHVVFAIDHVGMVGADGETHQGLFDISYLKAIPNLKILSATNAAELHDLLHHAVFACDGPVAIRYEKESFAKSSDSDSSAFRVVREGRDAVIITYGRLVYEGLNAVELLSKQGVSCGLVKLIELKPLALDKILASFSAENIFIFEECQLLGGLGETIAAESAKRKSNVSVHLGGVSDCFVSHGTVRQQLSDTGLDSETMARRVVEVLECCD